MQNVFFDKLLNLFNEKLKHHLDNQNCVISDCVQRETRTLIQIFKTKLSFNILHKLFCCNDHRMLTTYSTLLHVTTDLTMIGYHNNQWELLIKIQAKVWLTSRNMEDTVFITLYCSSFNTEFNWCQRWDVIVQRFLVILCNIKQNEDKQFTGITKIILYELTSFLQTPPGHLPEFSVGPNLASLYNLWYITYVLPRFTLSPFFSILFFYFWIFSTSKWCFLFTCKSIWVLQ